MAADDRMKRIEAEMAKFESEIRQKQMLPVEHSSMSIPPRPELGSNMSLSFFPHSINGPSMPPIISSGGPAVLGSFPPNPMLFRPPVRMPNLMPPPPPPAHSFSGPVIEAAPQRYSEAEKPKKSKKIEDTATSSAVQQRQTQVLPSDVELLAAKRQQEVAYQNSYIGQVLRGEKKMKRFIRTGGGEVWEDTSLAEWDPNDYRVFCGDLGNEVSDELLAKAFRRYSSFQKAKVVRDKRTNKSRGYGFVSFKDSQDFIRACREMDGKYVGNRPIKLRKSNWKERNLDKVKRKSKTKQKLGLRF